MSSTVYEVYERLRQAYGPAQAASAGSPWEAMIGAVLAQNAAPRHAEQALANLRRAGEQLLSLNGIGPETADAIILEAADKPAFVVEGHAARVFKRHGWIEFEADYYAIQEHFESALESSAVLFKEYRALLASVGADYCRKEPHCERCPLREMLPEGGPREPERF
jgi:endonuclease III-like uncharacterized protein